MIFQEGIGFPPFFVFIGMIIEPVHKISNNVLCVVTSKASDQPAHTRSLNRAFASGLSILLLLSH